MAPPVVPQAVYYDNQDTFSLDFDQLTATFITAIDNIRSHYNGLAPNSQQLNTPQYQESRCHAFFRMIGFPVVVDQNNFHSPGFDPNLNVDSAGLASNAKIDASFSSNNALTVLSQAAASNSREQVPIDFSGIFSNGGINAQAVMFGSVFIRSFGNQFTAANTNPLLGDKAEVQTIQDRITQVNNFYGPGGFQSQTATVSGYPILASRHFLKPFIVDPRIDGYIRPGKNRMCAPFLVDKSQTKIFLASNGVADSLPRPYLERVISVRYNNQNVASPTTPGGSVVQGIINQISSDNTTTEQNLVNTANNALGQLYSDQIIVYDNYFKIMRILIDTLVNEIKNVQSVMGQINFNPIPSPKTGVEGGLNGGQLGSVPLPGDPLSVNNNHGKGWERDIIKQMQNQILNTVILDAGLQGIPDPGDFVFSNINDSVFSINNNIQQSSVDNLAQLTDLRTQAGNSAITSLQNIELIMGEFSGIGLIDMVAIQAALWIMPGNSLLGLIDKRAFGRITTKNRPDINLNGATQNDVITSLTDFQSSLIITYNIIQDYFNNKYNGAAYSAPGTT